MKIIPYVCLAVLGLLLVVPGVYLFFHVERSVEVRVSGYYQYVGGRPVWVQDYIYIPLEKKPYQLWGMFLIVLGTCFSISGVVGSVATFKFPGK